MAKVPLQQNLTQQLQTGSEVQFSATSVNPIKDVVSDDIKRQGRAMQKLGEVINKLDDELNDAESKKLYNEFYSELENNHNEYLQFKGLDAVGYITTEDKTETKN